MVLAGILYVVSNPQRGNFYNHFVWQADAWLHGRVAIPYPVEPIRSASGAIVNWGTVNFQDVMPIAGRILGPTGVETGAALVPFPPLPGIVLAPFVALSGIYANQALLGALLAAVGVGLAWWLLGRLRVPITVRALVTIFFAFGTVWWWTAVNGTTWYFAHVIAVDLTLTAVGVALGADPGSADVEPWPDEENPGTDNAHDGGGSTLRRWIDAALPLDERQLVAGLLLGLAVTARLPMILGAPFLVLVGGGDKWPRRALSAAFGVAIPVGLLVAYNLGVTGSVFHPGYEYQYRNEAYGYTTLGYHLDWSIEDVRYIPQNLAIMFGAFPSILPTVLPNTLGPEFQADQIACQAVGATRGLFDPDCPIAIPRDLATSILLVSPALLLLLPVLRRGWGRSRLVSGSAVAIVLIALLNLAHFSQGWVQWGYRFSNDFIPFALPLVALGAASQRRAVRIAAIVLVGLSVLVNAWGVGWGLVLGW